MVYTSKIELEQSLSIHKDQKIKLTEHEAHKSYFLTEEAESLLYKTDMINNIIFDDKFDDNKEFVLAVEHLCYKNVQFSRKITKKLL
jgi:hypothetical protein